MQIEQLGPYRIGPRLGKGGMGSVYQATDEKTGQRVAVKALAPQLAQAEGFRERFEAEIESLKKLQHEGIVKLYGYGEDDGILFYSMELVDGPSLEQELNSGRRFDWNETLSIAIQICRALKHAHDHGVVHRDIKPANLLLAEDDRVKIADFGIARLFGSTQLTTAGGILGTADYMSPEQVDGRPVTDKCDQYALGCVMFALLAGRPPFRAKTMAEMLQLQRFAEPDPVRRYASETPEVLERLIGQLLSKDPAHRFPNALVLGRHMEAMQKALQRPAKPQPKEGRPDQVLWKEHDATAAPAMDVTLAQGEEILERLETTDSDVYDAPTLADDALTPAGRAASAVAASPTGAATATPKREPSKEKRFTIVDERAERARRARAERWAFVGQLVALAATIVTLGGLGWWLMQPATADALYATIVDADVDDPDKLLQVEDEVGEFLARFPDDLRTDDVRRRSGELELQRLAKQVRSRAKLSGGKGTHPAEQIYMDALAIDDSDPARAAEMLTSLLALYPKAANNDEDVARILVLAQRKLPTLQESVAKQVVEQMPQLEDRMRVAHNLEATDRSAAMRMYEALIDLYGDEAWAKNVTDAAQSRLKDLSQQH
jgi:serine/threonine protein kinase